MMPEQEQRVGVIGLGGEDLLIMSGGGGEIAARFERDRFLQQGRGLHRQWRIASAATDAPYNRTGRGEGMRPDPLLLQWRRSRGELGPQFSSVGCLFR
jgi:hypothetical protein